MIIWLSSNFERFAIYGMRDIFIMSKLGNLSLKQNCKNLQSKISISLMSIHNFWASSVNKGITLSVSRDGNM